jgi:hypothetical protein
VGKKGGRNKKGKYNELITSIKKRKKIKEIEDIN